MALTFPDNFEKTVVLVNKALITAYKATNYCTLEKQTELN